MKTSISFCAAASRNSRMVDAGRGFTTSAMNTPVDLILRSGLLAASRRMNGTIGGLMVRDARRRAPHHEELLAGGARLRLQTGAAVIARHPRQQIIDFRLGGRRDGGAGLALGAGGDDAAL